MQTIKHSSDNLEMKSWKFNYKYKSYTNEDVVLVQEKLNTVKLAKAEIPVWDLDLFDYMNDANSLLQEGKIQ